LADQGVVSATSFLTSLIVGRACGKEELGLFGLALAAMMIASEVQMALVSTPHMVNTPRLTGERLRRFHGSTLVHQFVLSFGFALILIVLALVCWMSGKQRLAMTLVALAAGIIVTSLSAHARNASFTDHRPGIALAIDSIACALQIVLLLVFVSIEKLSAATAVLTMTLSTLPPAVAWMIGSLRRVRPSISAASADLKWIWPQARFVFASALLWAAGMHLYPWLIDVNAGHAAVGAWSACFTVAAVGNPLMQGTINVIGPSIARQFTITSLAQFRVYVWKTTIAFAAMMSLFAIPLAVFGDNLVRLLYGVAYSGHGIVIALLAFGLVARAAGYVVSRGLFALDRADLDLYTNAAPLATLLLLGMPLTARFGAEGAAASLLVAQLLGAIVRAFFFTRSAHESTTKFAVTAEQAVPA
jgi:O-antigen/teichoic acid export membrane protein